MAEDTEDSEDRPPGRIKTGNGRRTFPRVGVTPRNTLTNEGPSAILPKQDPGVDSRVKEEREECEEQI